MEDRGAPGKVSLTPQTELKAVLFFLLILFLISEVSDCSSVFPLFVFSSVLLIKQNWNVRTLHPLPASINIHSVSWGTNGFNSWPVTHSVAVRTWHMYMCHSWWVYVCLHPPSPPTLHALNNASCHWDIEVTASTAANICASLAPLPFKPSWSWMSPSHVSSLQPPSPTPNLTSSFTLFTKAVKCILCLVTPTPTFCCVVGERKSCLLW